VNTSGLDLSPDYTNRVTKALARVASTPSARFQSHRSTRVIATAPAEPRTAPIVFEGVGFARRHRADQRVGLGFWQIGELFEQRGGHLFALPFFPRPDTVDLVDQPLPRRGSASRSFADLFL